MVVDWDGILRADILHADEVKTRHALADHAKNGAWPQMLGLLAEHKHLVNVSRLDGTSLYAPLHQLGYRGAPVDVAQQLIDLGAWRTLQNVLGERPLDVAQRMGHHHLLELFTPEFKHVVPHGILLKIQGHFHAVILERINKPHHELGLRLPELEPLLELEDPQMWFAVPGMYGGFRYRLESTGVKAKLVSESWCRVSEGSGRRHEITSAGSKLVASGFV